MNSEKIDKLENTKVINYNFFCLSCKKGFIKTQHFKRHMGIEGNFKCKRVNGCTNTDNLSLTLCQQDGVRQLEYYKKPKKSKIKNRH